MARIRSIKPEFWTSEQVADCSPTARLLFIGMWSFCDDYGVHPASTKRLKMEVFPADSFTLEQIDEWVNELKAAGLLIEYTAENQEFWSVTGWKHQRIEKPQSKYPKPPDGKIADQSPTSPRPIADRSPPERKGVEGNGGESKGKDATSLISAIAKNKKMPTNDLSPNYGDAATRKARWQQKIENELRLTLTEQRSSQIIAAYAQGEAWARQEYEKIDQRIKQRRESFAAVRASNGQTAA